MARPIRQMTMPRMGGTTGRCADADDSGMNEDLIDEDLKT